MRSSARSWPEPIRHLVAATAAITVIASLAACTTGTPTASPGVAAPTITGAWVRATQGMDRPTAGYLVITGAGQADALVSAKSSIAAMVEVHETTTDASGMTGMHPIGRLEIPAGATVTLQPGGYHLMFMNLTETVEVGATVQIELTFEKAGTITVSAEVRQG